MLFSLTTPPPPCLPTARERHLCLHLREDFGDGAAFPDPQTDAFNQERAGAGGELPWLGSQSLKLLPALGLPWSGMAQGWHASPRALLITLIPPLTGLPASELHAAAAPTKPFSQDVEGLWHG